MVALHAVGLLFECKSGYLFLSIICTGKGTKTGSISSVTTVYLSLLHALLCMIYCVNTDNTLPQLAEYI